MVQTVAVLAAAYKGKRAALDVTRTHAFDTRTGATLCGKVNPDSLADDSATNPDLPATCPTCAKRDPRRPAHANEGPFLLKSLLQF